MNFVVQYIVATNALAPGRMPTLFLRLIGLLILVLTISLSSCQAVFPIAHGANAEQPWTPSFVHGR